MKQMINLEDALTALIREKADDWRLSEGIEELASILGIDWINCDVHTIEDAVDEALEKWSLDRLGELLLGEEHPLVHAWETETNSIYREMETNYKGGV